MDQADLQAYVGELSASEGLPGALVAISHRGRRLHAAAGMANLNTGAAMTVDTGFLLGSISKVWVTTLLMMQIDAGLLTLETPVLDLLPELRLADAGAARELTVRHLVTHTSGIDGADHCPDDLGRGADAVAKYVDTLADLGQLHPPGQMWSYCNPGFVIAGRVIEVLTGRTFADAVREQLLDPLDLSRTFMSAEDAILWPAAVGHFSDPSGGSTRTTGRYLLPEAMSPAGTTLSTTLDDALTFAELHLGRGSSLVSASCIATMAAHHVDLPVPALGGFGLGWGRSDRAGTVVLSHGGGSLGGLAQLVVVPTADLAVVAFGNSALAAPFMATLIRHVLTEYGVPPAGEDVDPGPAAPPERFLGVFRRHDFLTTISAEGEELVVQTTPNPASAVLRAYGASTPAVVRCRPSGPRSFSLPPSSSGAVASAAGFIVGEDYLYAGGRLARRVAGAA